MSKPTIICLTPVKNEAWILDRFLKCASLWADHIIIADNFSDDGSREIAQNYPKVILINNNMITYSEYEMRKILFEEARKISGPRLLISMDADEVLTANFMESQEWQTVLNAKPGTVIGFNLINIKPDLTSYWSPDSYYMWGFMDDGSEYQGSKIHTLRIPIPDKSPRIMLNEIKFLHYQYTDWERMESKHRWYQCWERLNNPKRRPISIYRQYHHMYSIASDKIKKLQPEWFSGYEQKGIDMFGINRSEFYRWDKVVLAYFDEYGTAKFRQEAIWDVDWFEIAKKVNSKPSGIDLSDPRNSFEKRIHNWLKKTQPHASSWVIKLMDLSLRIFGW
jgi:glycosyltransferase involved in cell wall biosynthesis